MRRSLLITLLALTLSALALALADAPPKPPPKQPTQSLTCTGAPLGPWLDCLYESPSLHLGTFELTTGAYFRLDASGPYPFWTAEPPGSMTVISLAPYVTLAQYTPTYAWWIEARVPKLAHIPMLGITDPLRVGFTYRW